MPIRRYTDPVPLQHIWDAIRLANAQKQMADYNRIIKYLQRTDNCTIAQAELHLKQSIDDGLVIALNKTTSKGAKIGSQVESYKIPSYDVHIVLDDYKDWYCIDCHLGGDVVHCRLCQRVYHEECANKKQYIIKKIHGSNNTRNALVKDETDVSKSNVDNNETTETEEVIDITNDNDSLVNNNVIDKKDNEMDKDSKKLLQFDQLNITEVLGVKMIDPIDSLLQENCQEYDLTLCSICNMCKLEPKLLLQKEELNYLLTFVHGRIKTWLPSNIADKMSAEPKSEWLTEVETTWRSKLLIHHPMNMSIIESKLKMNEYNHLVQFKADVLTIQHNVAIFHGIESQEYGASEYMLEDCRYDLTEILNCPDCYKHSNEKINNKWFCLPCRTPHKLVWAKQKGYPYWPAKVLKETDNSCDVRFFGGKYERSVLHNMYIKPITMKMNDSQAKKSTAFNRAVNELMLHQRMLGVPSVSRSEAVIKSKKSERIFPFKKFAKKDNSKRTAKYNTDSDDDLFNKTAQALEASFSAQNAALNTKRKCSETPFSKSIKMPRRTTYHISKSKFASSSPKNGMNEVSAHFSLSSDTEEEESFRKKELFNQAKEGNYGEVTSSTEQIKITDEQSIRDNLGIPVMPETERQYSESVEKTRRKLEQCHDKKQLIRVSLECMQAEIDSINNAHDDYLKKLFEVHSTQISETKKKQWCYNCEQDAIYHCCWNTAYCSPTCQQQHWQAEHKKVCRRKR